jgi:superfamily I DNA/RNA helicase
VFISDVNDGVLPRAIDGDDEEAASGEAETARRLLYVGMTRAMQELYLTTTDAKRSPLIAELPTSGYQQVTGR